MEFFSLTSEEGLVWAGPKTSKEAKDPFLFENKQSNLPWEPTLAFISCTNDLHDLG